MSADLADLSGAIAAGGICVGIGLYSADAGPVAIGLALWALAVVVWGCTS